MGAPVIFDFPKLVFPLLEITDYCIVFGQFGVGVFFIVSGLVIPFSLENFSRTSFIFRRAMRIYPVYITGFSVVILSLLSLSYYTGTPFKYSISEIVAHFGIITRGPLGVERIDGISWTLEVELYFYLAMMIFGSYILNFDLKRYIFAIVFISVAAAFILKKWGYLPGTQAGSGLLLILGIAYYSFFKTRITLKDLWIIQIIVSILIIIHWMYIAGWNRYTIQWAIGYLLGVAVFYVCFAFRDKIRSSSLLSHFSDISYPLYVVHALFGYAVMYILVDHGFQPLSTIILTFIMSYVVALLIHTFVEKPTLSWIKSGARIPFLRSEHNLLS